MGNSSMVFKKGSRKYYYYRVRRFDKEQARGYSYAEYSTHEENEAKARDVYVSLLKRNTLVPSSNIQIYDIIEGIRLNNEQSETYLILNKIYAEYMGCYLREYCTDVGPSLRDRFNTMIVYNFLHNVYLPTIMNFEKLYLTPNQIFELDTLNLPSIKDDYDHKLNLIYELFYLPYKKNYMESITNFVPFIFLISIRKNIEKSQNDNPIYSLFDTIPNKCFFSMAKIDENILKMNRIYKVHEFAGEFDDKKEHFDAIIKDFYSNYTAIEWDEIFKIIAQTTNFYEK